MQSRRPAKVGRSPEQKAIPTPLDPNEADRIRVLLIEDNEDDVFLTRRAFTSSAPNISIDAVTRGEEGIARAEQGGYDVAVVDYQLPDLNGMEVLYSLVKLELPVIIVTGKGDEKTAVQALKSGAVDYLVKDEGYLRRLPQACAGAVVRNRLIKENQRLIAETARQASLLEAVLNTDPGAVAVLRGPEFRVELANLAFRKFMPRFDEIAPIGKTLSEIMPTPIVPEMRQALHLVYETGQPFATQSKLVLLNGEQHYFHIHFLPLNADSQSKERGVAVILWETTEEMLAQQRVEEMAQQAEAQRTWLQAVIDQMPSGVYIVAAPDGEILFTNLAADEMLGPPPVDRIKAEGAARLYNASNPDGTEVGDEEMALVRALRGETVIGRHMVVAAMDGTQRDILSNTAPLYDTAGQIVAAVTVFQDISEMKNLDRMKDEFMSIASHELRTPLTNMRAAAQLLVRRVRTGEYPRGEVSLINTVMQQSEHMTRLVEELLDVSRLQSGRLQIHAEPLDLTMLVREIMSTSKLSNPDFDLSLEASAPVWVVADRDRIAQVVSNLVDNAVKYTNNPGSIRATVESLPEQDLAQVEVHDTGVGFEPSEAERIFERFSRLGSVAHHSRGMGLGLFICRQIIAAHGGTISAASPGPGQGATVTFTLPLAHIAEE